MVSRKIVMRHGKSSRIDSRACHCARHTLIWILICCISLPGYAFAGMPELTLPEIRAIEFQMPEFQAIDSFGDAEDFVPKIGFETYLRENTIPLSLFSPMGDPPDWPVNNVDLYQMITSYGDLEFTQELSVPKAPFGRYQKLVNHSAAIALLAIGSITVLYYSPESASQWKEEDKDMSWDELSSRYYRKTKYGPVIDEDETWINYIGHPYWGGIYYTHARTLGYTRTEAFMFSLAVSTIIYEYGFEAFFEEPSLQDLIFTPFWGALVGEIFMFTGSKIKANSNKVLGSRALGTLCLVLMNPLGYTISGLTKLTNNFSNFGMDLEYIAKRYNAPNDQLMSDGPWEYMYGLKVNIFTR
jgi:hypothetical protein